jgi:hypothetical protein
VNELRPVQRAYIAGFFDGEGCVHRRKPNGRPILVFYQREPDILLWIQKTLGYGRFLHQVRESGETWRLVIQKHEEALALVNAMLKYSHVKKAQLRSCKSWLEEVSEEKPWLLNGHS